MCGEHVGQVCRVGGVAGPSPRVRGAPRLERVVSLIAGTIPACAGSTISPAGRTGRPRDHPRVCGEHAVASLGSAAFGGPSPRVRGALTCPVNLHTFPGTIPACAGSTNQRRRACSRLRDHPRVCGEHPELGLQAGAGLGPSPRVRGAPWSVNPHRRWKGTIPACAGSTAATRCCGCAARDHPRVCGEHSLTTALLPWASGPSPRVRGARGRGGRGGRGPGTIPACAGSTSGGEGSGAAVRDHPRVCGEHSERPGTLPAFRTVFLHFSKNRRNTHPVENHPQHTPSSPNRPRNFTAPSASPAPPSTL